MGPRVGQWSGWVYKQGSRVKTWKKRYMVLQGRHITYYDKSVLEPNPIEKGALVLVDVTQNFAIANGLFLHDNKGKQMKIYTDTTAEFQDCFISMQRACRGDAPPSAVAQQQQQASYATSSQRYSSSQSLSSDVPSYRPSSGNPEPVTLARPSRAASERLPSHVAVDSRFGTPERALSERVERMHVSPDSGACPRATGTPSGPKLLGSGYLRTSSSESNDGAPLVQRNSSGALGRKEVLRGWLHKEGQHVRNWKRRYFVLTGDHLAYYGKQGEAAKGEGRVLEVAVNPQKAFGLLIRLDSDRILRVAAESEDDMERWQSGLRAALKNQEYLERRISSSIRYAGYLHKKGSNIKTWHRRWFMLTGLNQLGYCDKEGETPKGYGKVIDVCVNHKRAHCLYVHLDSGRRLSVAADSQNDIDGWYQVLSKVAAAVAQNQQQQRSSAPDATNEQSLGKHTSHSGWLQKEGKSIKSWKRRYFTLHDRMLVYHKDMEGGNAVGQGIVSAVTEGMSRPFSIDVHFETGRVLRVAANSERDRAAWMAALNRGIQARRVESTGVHEGVSLGSSSSASTEFGSTATIGPMEGWLEWEGARTFFTLTSGRDFKWFANPNGLVLGKGTLKDMRVENFRDFIMHIVFTNATPIRVKAESSEELNAWRHAITMAMKGQLVATAAPLPTTDSSTHAAAAGPLVKQEGWMLKEGSKMKNWKRRYFILKGTELMYYKNEMLGSVLGQANFVHVKPNPEKQWSLIVILETGRLLVVALNSEHEEAMWLKAFQTALLQASHIGEYSSQDAPQATLAAPAPVQQGHTAPPPAPLAAPSRRSAAEHDEYDDADDDIYNTQLSSADSLVFEDFDNDDDDDELDSDMDNGSISSDDEVYGRREDRSSPTRPTPAAAPAKPNYDSDGLSSLSSMSDFED
ncbi:hypothetical protein DYB32_006946 [Aphanomyces invadans]|uniref:PH domain-containing protein n=1 Tax=Aphanomyces invadans TaxID=157072 RepID=A0A3R7CXC3_9STRA|nr:hypothetical protein DYB32_006946 [Aphanomyces invadans]